MKRPAQFEIMTGPGQSLGGMGQTYYFWHVRGSNGRIVCWSEAYKTKAACRKAIAAVQAAKKVVEK